jgi:hypothetical protein
VARKRSAGPSGKGVVAVRTAVHLGAAPVTAVLDRIREITMRTKAPWFLFDEDAHYSAAYPIPANTNETR